jgi:hypothetical protein
MTTTQCSPYSNIEGFEPRNYRISRKTADLREQKLAINIAQSWILRLRARKTQQIPLLWSLMTEIARILSTGLNRRSSYPYSSSRRLLFSSDLAPQSMHQLSRKPLNISTSAMLPSRWPLGYICSSALANAGYWPMH